MAVTGANKVKSNLRKVFNDISDKKSLQFLNAVLAGAGNISKQKAPIELGTLVNSQRIEVSKGNRGYVGTLGYYTGYAGILNNGVYKWKPRPPSMKAGNAWNPDAEPHFLEYGFESPEGIKNINDNLKIFRV